MKSRSQKKMQTRQRLIQSALELSAQKGFSSLSLREVAVAAGITPAAFYNHFENMEELGLSLFDEVGMSLRRLLRKVRKDTQDNHKTVTSYSINAFLNYVNENSNLFRLLLGERQGASKSFRRALFAEIDLFVVELVEDLERLAAIRGEKLRNPSLAAEAIIAVVFTVGAEALELPVHKQDGLRSRLTEEVNMIMRGARSSD